MRLDPREIVFTKLMNYFLLNGGPCLCTGVMMITIRVVVKRLIMTITMMIVYDKNDDDLGGGKARCMGLCW